MKNRLLKSFFAVVFFTISSVVYGEVYCKYITSEHTNVYSEPKKESKVIGRLKDEKKVKSNTIIDKESYLSMSWYEQQNSWLEIEYEGGIGYIPTRCVYLSNTKVIRTGDDYKSYINWLESRAAKNGDSLDSGNEVFITNLILTLIAGFLYWIAGFLPRIKGKGGWISGLCLITIASLIVIYQFMQYGYEGVRDAFNWPEKWFGVHYLLSILVMIVSCFLLVRVVFKSVNCVFRGMNNSGDLGIRWTLGLLIPALGGFLLVLDDGFNWSSNSNIVKIIAILHLLYCIFVVIVEFAERSHSPGQIISLIVIWQIVAFAFFNLSIVVAISVSIIGLIIIGILFARLLFNIILEGPTYTTSDGRVLEETLLFGLRDKAGEEYLHVGDDKVVKKRDLD